MRQLNYISTALILVIYLIGSTALNAQFYPSTPKTVKKAMKSCSNGPENCSESNFQVSFTPIILFPPAIVLPYIPTPSELILMDKIKENMNNASYGNFSTYREAFVNYFPNLSADRVDVFSNTEIKRSYNDFVKYRASISNYINTSTLFKYAIDNGTASLGALQYNGRAMSSYTPHQILSLQGYENANNAVSVAAYINTSRLNRGFNILYNNSPTSKLYFQNLNNTRAFPLMQYFSSTLPGVENRLQVLYYNTLNSGLTGPYINTNTLLYLTDLEIYEIRTLAMSIALPTQLPTKDINRVFLDYIIIQNNLSGTTANYARSSSFTNSSNFLRLINFLKRNNFSNQAIVFAAQAIEGHRRNCPVNYTNQSVNCVLKKWYLDKDGDNYYSEMREAYTQPGPLWKENLTEMDCDDTDATKTTECQQSDPFIRNGLTEQQNEVLDSAIEDLKETCLGNALISAVDNVNVSVSELGSGAIAQYNPSTNTIMFSENGIGNSLGEELFHAYQQQLYGTLVDISNSSSGHIGGSNIEFEEKAYTLLNGWIDFNSKYKEWENNPDGFFVEFPPDVFPGTEPLNEWVLDLIENHSAQNGNVTLSSQEFNSWLAGVDNFREHWFTQIGCGSTAGNVYGCPKDNNQKPDALINLFNKTLENCN